MSFVHPEYLWLLSALIPLIILKLSKKSSHVVVVPNVSFWLAEKEIQNTKKTIRLYKIWRYLLLFLLFIIANISLAKPYIGKVGNEKTGSNIIIVDTSITMGAIANNKTHLQFAIEAIQDKFALSDNTIIITTDKTPRTLSIEELLEVKYGTSNNIHKTIELVQQISNDQDNVIIFTDGVHTAWKNEIERLKQHYKDKLFIHIIGEESHNIGIFANYNHFTNEITISIYHNYSLPKMVNLSWGKINSIPNDILPSLENKKQIELAQGIVETKIILNTFSLSGWWEFRIEEEESFVDDNRIFCYVSPEKKCKVLLIGDEEQKIVAALGAYQNLIDRSSNLLKQGQTIDFDTVYDLLIVHGDDYNKVDKVNYKKALLWKTNNYFLEKKSGEIKNIYNPKVNTHQLSKNIDFSNLHIKKGDVYNEIREKIISHQDGELVWMDFINEKECIYVGFQIKDSNIALLPSFPIWIKNIIEWATPQSDLKYQIQQITSSPIYLKRNLAYQKEFLHTDAQKDTYLDWYFMFIAYILCIICCVYLLKR